MPDASNAQFGSSNSKRFTSTQNKFGLEWLLIIVFAYLYCGNLLLNFDPAKLQQTGEHNESSTLPLLAEIGLRRYGEIPLWNPYMLTGIPHNGDMLAHFWNPISTIPIAMFGGINGMKVSIFLSFITAGLGQWMFAYTMGLRRLFRLWSAILFMISGGLALLWRVGWYELLLGAAWFPWCFSFFLQALKHNNLAAIIKLSASIFMVVSAGGGYYPFYLIGSFAVIFTIVLIKSDNAARLKIMRTTLLTVLFSAGLCAVIILPYFESYRYMSRDVAPDKVQYFSQPIQYGLMNYVIHTTEWFRANVLGTGSGWNWFYIGWLPVAALIFMPLAFEHAARQRWNMLVSGILFLILIMWFANQYSPFKIIYTWLPVLYNLRFPSRLLIIAASPLLIFSAQLLEFTFRLSRVWVRDFRITRRSATGRNRFFPAHVAVSGFWIILLTVTSQKVYSINREFAFVDQNLNQKSFVALRWLKSYDRSLYYTNIGGGIIYWDWTPAAYALEMPMINFLYSRHLRTQDAQRGEGSPFIAQAKYQISLPDQSPPPNSQSIHEFEGIFIWQIPDVLPYAFSVQPSLVQKYTKLDSSQVNAISNVKLHGPNSIVVKGSPKQDGDFLVVLMSNYPGWKLKIDDKPATVRPANDYLGARMLPGEHTYTFYFMPTSFIIGALVSMITLTLMIFFTLSPYIKVRQQVPQPQKSIHTA